MYQIIKTYKKGVGWIQPFWYRKSQYGFALLLRNFNDSLAYVSFFFLSTDILNVILFI